MVGDSVVREPSNVVDPRTVALDVQKKGNRVSYVERIRGGIAQREWHRHRRHQAVDVSVLDDEGPLVAETNYATLHRVRTFTGAGGK